jgi:TP901 family phage tail tape measure protein
MARTSATISVGADTRQLERDIQKALGRDFKFKGLNEKTFTQPLGRITGASNEFQKSLDASNARVIAFGASAGLIFGVERAFTSLVKSTIDVQRSLTDINVILNVSTDSLQRFGDGLFTVARDTAQTFDTVAQAATEFSRQGLGLEETLKRTRDALILTRLSGLDTIASVEALTATINSFSNAALDSTIIINKLANVDAAFAVSSSDLAEAIKRVGSSAQDVGVDFDQLLAIVTSVQQTTARGGSVIGNSLKTIFTRIQRTDTLDSLEELGIQVRNIEGNTLPAIQILSNLATTFNRLGDAQRAQVAEQVGGVFQINILRAALADLGKEYSVYNNALRVSASSTNEAIIRNEALNQTLSALINKTFVNLTKVGADIGRISFQPTFENLLQLLNRGLEQLDADSKSVGGKIGRGILEGIGEFISGPGVVLATAVLGKLLINLGKFAADSLQTVLNINVKAQERAQIQTKINQILAQEPALVQAVYNKQISILDVENKILNIIRQQTIERERAAALSTTIAGGLFGKGVTTKGGTLKAKSQGFIPNFASSEILGALAGGYSPGYVRKMNIPGEGSVTYNSAEKVKKFPGMSQPAIMPPMQSNAGKNYQSQFNSVYGFNPYASRGFIPNFAKIPTGMSLEQAVKGNYSRSVLSSKFGAKAVEKILGPSRVVGAGAKERNLGFTSAISMIYPAKIGKSIATGGFRDAEGDRYRLSFNQSGFNAKTAIKPEDAQLENSLGKNIIGFVNNYISQLSNGKFPQITDINQLANAGSFKSIVGTVFETAVSYATKSFKPREGGQSALIDFPFPNKNLRELFNFAPGQYEAKGSNNQDLINDVARKAYLSGFVNDKISRYKSIGKNKSGGFIPNFTALNESVNREIMAGVSPNRVRIGQDSRLTSASNPLGLGVYNTKDEPLGLGQGISRSGGRAKNAGAAGGFIPNFVAPLLAGGIAIGSRALLALSIGVPIINETLKEVLGGQNKATDALDIATKALSFGLSGSIFGKKSGILATLAGAALALYNQLNKNGEATDQLNKNIEDNKDRLQTFSSAVVDYNTSLEKLKSEELQDNDRQRVLTQSNEALATILTNTPEKLLGGLKSAIEGGNLQEIQQKIGAVQVALQTNAANTESLANIINLTKDKQLTGEELNKFTNAILELRTGRGTALRTEILERPDLRQKFSQDLSQALTSLIERNQRLGVSTPIIGRSVGGISEEDLALGITTKPVGTGGQAEQDLIKETNLILNPIRNLLVRAGIPLEDVVQTLTELEKLSFESADSGSQALGDVLKSLGVTTQNYNKELEKTLQYTKADILRRSQLAGDVSSSNEAALKFAESLNPEALNQYAKTVLDANTDLKANRIASAKVLDSQEGIYKSILNETERRKVNAKFIEQTNNLLSKGVKDLDKFVLAIQGTQEELIALNQRARGLMFAEDFRGARQTARENRILGGETRLEDFPAAFFDEFDYRTEDSFREAQLGAKETARTIKSEFNNAFLSFANGSQTASESFTAFANNVANKVQQLALDFSTNLIFGKLFGSTSNIFGGGGGGGGIGGFFGSLFKSKGGLIKGYSTGGNVVGGSGNKDDVPAMLSGGEYVVRKSAVNKYGQEYLQMLNEGKVEKRFLGGAAGVAMAGLAQGNPSMFQNIAPVFGINLGNSKGSNQNVSTNTSTNTSPTSSVGMGTRQRNREDNYFKYGGRVQRFANGGELQFLGENTYRYNDALYPTAGENVIDPRLSLRAILDPNNPQNEIRKERELNLLNYIRYVEEVNLANQEALQENVRQNQEIQNQYNRQKSQASQGALFSYLLGLGGAGLTLFNQGGRVKKFAQGGSSQDNIPALLMGGEFVMRKEAVNLYGKKFFDDLNSGRVKRFAEGGSVGGGSQSGTSNYSPTNNVSVVVNLNQEKIVSDTTQQSATTPNQEREEENRRTREIAARVKDQVIRVITEQQRPGGLLSSSVYIKR